MRKTTGWLWSCAVVALIVSGLSAARAAVMFGATSAGGPGELFTLNSATGAAITDVGPIHDAGNVNYPITGLAVNPISGVLYGSTGNAGAVDALLVTINPLTALATVIGPFNAGPTNSSGTPATMADLAFDSAGNLYGVGSIGGPQLYSINKATGQATVIGNTGLTSTTGGGLDVSPANVFFGTPTSTRFGTYNSTTGAYTNIAAPTKPLGGAYAALAFDGPTLYGLNLGPGPALATDLVTIDTATGAVTVVGSSVPALDAIAFVPIPEPGSFALLAISGTIVAAMNRRRRIA
jgi:hypothetical protein